VRLEEAEGGAATVLHYDLEAQVGGRIAGVGQRLLDSSARVIARQGLEGLEKQLAVRQAAGRGGGEAGSGGEAERVEDASEAEMESSAADSGPGAIGAAPSQREFAGRFARGMWEDLVPAAARPWVILGVVAVVVVVVWLVVR
jgi:uncharacterized protein